MPLENTLVADPSQDMIAPDPVTTEPEVEAEDEATESVKANVKRWLARIKSAERHWDSDFKRMKENMEFACGIQYNGQQTITSERYVANMTLRMVNQKVATLYARNPSFEAIRREKQNFLLWDEKVESINEAMGMAMVSQQMGQAVPPESMAMMSDYQRGKAAEELVERVGKSLEMVYKYQMETQQPNFKVQAKQFVRRVSITGVGYIKVLFCREYEGELLHNETNQSITERAQSAKEILGRLENGEITEDSPEVETLRSLVSSIGLSPVDTESVKLKEHLIFDFPPSTCIIPDETCRCLKGFVGAHWVAEKFFYPLKAVNAKFGTDIKPGGELKEYQHGKELTTPITPDDTESKDDSPIVCLYQVYDIDTKSTLVVCDGYKAYVQAPETLTPATASFWNIFPLTFNDVESEIGTRASIFPPSDVELIRHPQKEWNRTRDALRAQRKANAPKYMCPKGTLSVTDLEKIVNAEGNQVVELEGIAPGADPSKVMIPLQVAPIDQAVYDTRPLAEDAMLTTGQQESNMGPAQPNVTATVGTIAEQSRMTVASSNVDDLDDCLSAVANCGGEMLLREMSKETVQQIAGVGAVWPEDQRELFLSQLALEVVAASSGRPNKAIEVANFQQLAPLLLQAGANPQAIIREAIKRLDDRLDPTEFFPIMPPPMPSQGTVASDTGPKQVGGPPTGAEQAPPGPGSNPPVPPEASMPTPVGQ